MGDLRTERSGETVIETRDLRKVYRSGRRRTVALDGLDLSVPRGGVHGFLGPNGSGKTTTIRLLLGLARPGKGEMRLFGEPVPERLPELLPRVGAVVEEPRFVPSLSGRRNLTLLARVAGRTRADVDAALHVVGLTDTARRRYGSYSLGMRQRLAIAAALVKDPALLILDEPTNGLDPAGIRSIRDLVRDLGDSGVTVLLSSHNLAEVQQVCHSVSIVDHGRLVASGPVVDLLGDGIARTGVRVADTRRARQVLTEAGFEVDRHGDQIVVQGHEHPEHVTQALAERGLYVQDLREIRPTLESVFLRLTGHRPGRHVADERSGEHR